MKMVKKCIIALAVVALMVTVVHADSPSIKKDGGWPSQYIAQTICKFDVLMEVGFYVQLKDCGDRELILKQEPCADIGKGDGDFPCYRGCEDIQVRANFKAVFGATLDKEGSILDKTSLYWANGKDQIDGSLGGDAWETLTICLDAWKAQLWHGNVPANSKPKVGEITINVKPPDS